MYGANILVSEPPARADEETFKQYAARPSWHIEAAASLAAGYVPRANLFACPICPTNDIDDQAAADSNWYYLLLSKSPVGRTIDFYALTKKVIGRAFSPDMLMVEPKVFLTFCDANDIEVHPQLRKAFVLHRRRHVDPAKPDPHGSVKYRRQRIREFVLSVADELKGADVRTNRALLLRIFLAMPGNTQFNGLSGRAFRLDLKALEPTLPELTSVLMDGTGQQAKDAQAAFINLLPKHVRTALD